MVDEPASATKGGHRLVKELRGSQRGEIKISQVAAHSVVQTARVQTFREGQGRREAPGTRSPRSWVFKSSYGLDKKKM